MTPDENQRLEALLEEALAIVRAIREGEEVETTVVPLSRVVRIGRHASRHRQREEELGRALTLGEARELHRPYFKDVRSMANLYGRSDAGALLYREVDFGTRPKDDQVVHLTEEGMRLADEYEAITPADAASA